MSEPTGKVAIARVISDLETQLAEKKESLNDLVHDIERIGEVILKLRDALQAYEALSLDFQTQSEEEEKEEEADGRTHFQKIADYLLGDLNFPKTIAEIVEGTGIPRASVAAVIYRTHPDKFSHAGSPGGRRPKAWCLRHESTPSLFGKSPSEVEEEIPF